MINPHNNTFLSFKNNYAYNSMILFIGFKGLRFWCWKLFLWNKEVFLFYPYVDSFQQQNLSLKSDFINLYPPCPKYLVQLFFALRPPLPSILVKKLGFCCLKGRTLKKEVGLSKTLIKLIFSSIKWSLVEISKTIMKLQ